MTTSLIEFTHDHEGCRLHYWRGGDPSRPMIVLTHGAGADHRTFDAQLPALLDNYQMLTWDMRGHGLSRPMGEPFTIQRATADLLAILDHLQSHPAIFAGHSMGGNVTQEIVYQQPDRVRALIVIDAACNTLPLSIVEKFSVAIAPSVFKLLPYEALKKQSARACGFKPEVQAYVYNAMSQVTKDEFTQFIVAGLRNLHVEPNYRITQPMLLVHGDHDETGNIKKIAPAWARREPHCRYVVIPNARHCAHQDNPDFFNRVLLEFLSDL
ncbi:MAG TPA: alpha/beta hydrolase [Anaerolineae bacterium]|nr:alpha/beta hydrolase [Anaerolineae bacterium]